MRPNARQTMFGRNKRSMKNLRAIIALTFAAIGSTMLEAQADDVKSLVAVNLPVRGALGLYEKLSGKPVLIPPDLNVDALRVSFKCTNRTRSQALRLIEIALLVKDHLQIVHRPDGTSAVQIFAPNKPPDPAPPSVTPPAGAGGAPSVAAAH